MPEFACPSLFCPPVVRDIRFDAAAIDIGGRDLASENGVSAAPDKIGRDPIAESVSGRGCVQICSVYTSIIDLIYSPVVFTFYDIFIVLCVT